MSRLVTFTVAATMAAVLWTGTAHAQLPPHCVDRPGHECDVPGDTVPTSVPDTPSPPTTVEQAPPEVSTSVPPVVPPTSEAVPVMASSISIAAPAPRAPLPATGWNPYVLGGIAAWFVVGGYVAMAFGRAAKDETDDR